MIMPWVKKASILKISQKWLEIGMFYRKNAVKLGGL
jgi:hypothetical protein